MKLTDLAIRTTKHTGDTKFLDLPDGKGLYLRIDPSGRRWWRFRFTLLGKQGSMSFGDYPDVSLKRAREKAQEARAKIADGVNPSHDRKAQRRATQDRSTNSFEAVAREWHGKMARSWAPSHGGRLLRRLELHAFPWIGDRPVAELTAPEILSVLRRIEQAGSFETAHRAHQSISQVLDYAIATGRSMSNPAPSVRRSLVPSKARHFAAVTDAEKVGPLLLKLDGHKGTFVVRCALQLAPLLFVRPGELRHAEWSGVDFQRAEWRYRVSKTGTDHVVPLSKQAVKILRELEALTGRHRYVFTGARDVRRPMSENAVLAALRSLGIPRDEMSGHGFRAMARTLLDEELGERPDFVEHQLAHAVRDANGRAYNRTSHLDARHQMMQRWADWLDARRAEALQG